MRASIFAALALFGATLEAQAVDHVANCRREVQGTKIQITSTINVLRKDLSARLNEVDIPKYCQCLHRMLRQRLGDDLYERSQAFNGQLTDAELKKHYEQEINAQISCVEAQVGNKNKSAVAIAATRSAQDLYLRFMRSTISPGNGVGGLRVGDTKAALFKVLGPTKTFQRTRDGGERYFYGPNATEVVVSVSPGPRQTVRQIELNYRFQGQTPGGGRMRDPRDKIKQTYSGKLAVDVPEYAVYCDGTTFLFQSNDGRLQGVRLSELDSDVFKQARLKNCPKRQ